MPTHACGPISHAWLKNVSCCRLAWHNFQKYVNSDHDVRNELCKMNKWQYLSRDLLFLKRKALGASLRLYWDWDFGRFQMTSGFFGRLRASSGILIGKWACGLQKSVALPGEKISRPYLRKSWQVYITVSLNYTLASLVSAAVSPQFLR